ncbi:hypothetical protein [Actinoplanes sp. NPDC020271]|uniref:hypothetical protein n=1 Tax=Actinoplanes sp. NPDC020271 TaxID=3363896 RepID=UPI0037B88288
MPKEHEDLGVELGQLWDAGHRDLPAVTAVLTSARSDLTRAPRAWESAFRRPVEFGTGHHGKVYTALSRMNDVMVTILRDSAENLNLAAEALLLAAEVYADTDERAARELAAHKIDLSGHGIEARG